jgi:hypothetical protein
VLPHCQWLYFDKITSSCLLMHTMVCSDSAQIPVGSFAQYHAVPILYRACSSGHFGRRCPVSKSKSKFPTELFFRRHFANCQCSARYASPSRRPGISPGTNFTGIFAPVAPPSPSPGPSPSFSPGTILTGSSTNAVPGRPFQVQVQVQVQFQVQVQVEVSLRTLF